MEGTSSGTSGGIVDLTEESTESGMFVLKVSGFVTVYTAPDLRAAIIDWVAQGRYRFALDLGDVDFLDSTGLGVIVGGLKRVRAHDGGLILIMRGNERIMKIFRITGLTKVFVILNSVEEYDVTGIQITAQSLDGVEFSGNWLPIRVYLSDAEPRHEVEQALRYLTSYFGINDVIANPGVEGSWWREIIAHMRVSGSQSEQLALLERAIQQELLLGKQAQNDSLQGRVVSELIVALEKTPQAVIQVGSVLLVKVEETVLVRNLTQRELAFYERNPALFKDPVNAMLHLQRAASGEIDVILGPGVVDAVGGAMSSNVGTTPMHLQAVDGDNDAQV